MKDFQNISLSNAHPTTIAATKTVPTKIGNKNCSDDGPSNNNADNIRTGTESVQNKGDRPQSSPDVDFIVNLKGTEQLSCHDIESFGDTSNLDEAAKYGILTGHFHPDDDFKFQ